MVEEAPILFFELPEIKRNLPDTLSLREIEIFLDMPDLSTLKGLRDRAILEVLYGAGLKATELINLKVRDADLTRGYIRVKERNGSEREVPIGNYAIESIENYLSKREDNISPASALFPSSRNEAMSRQGLWKILKGYEEMSNIDQNININTLRHSYAVHMLEGGADLNTVSNLMGHKDVNSTAVYLKLVKNKKIKEVYKNSHPRA
ncbi:MAG: tyrosine-type recombinase/integrase [Clostridium sp.]|nr:tyrosine-type recombinase/integrase [Clostridium sp.]